MHPFISEQLVRDRQLALRQHADAARRLPRRPRPQGRTWSRLRRLPFQRARLACVQNRVGERDLR